jgi:hypothetical protein
MNDEEASSEPVGCFRLIADLCGSADLVNSQDGFDSHHLEHVHYLLPSADLAA